MTRTIAAVTLALLLMLVGISLVASQGTEEMGSSEGDQVESTVMASADGADDEAEEAGTVADDEAEGAGTAAEDEAEGAGTAAEDEAEGAGTAADGLYTEEQADRGLEQYEQHCQMCHGEELTGEDPFPPLTGTRFFRSWEGRSLFELFDYTRHNMPLGRPGSLDDQTYIDIMAHWLRFHDYPAGDSELPIDEEVLEGVTLEPQEGEAAE